MKNVIIIGAGGGIARIVTGLLLQRSDFNLTLFLRNPRQLGGGLNDRCTIIEGDAASKDALVAAVKGQDIVYINLAGDLAVLNRNIISAMKEQGVKTVIFISSIGIYDTPVKPVLRPYREGADVIEASGLDYTILRPEWFSEQDDSAYELTQKGTPEKGGTIARKALATLITDIISAPDNFKNQNLGVSNPRNH